MQKDDPVVSGLESYGLAFDEIIVDIVAHTWIMIFSKVRNAMNLQIAKNLYTFS